MRKILSLVLVLALVLGAFPAFADNGMSELEIANKLKEFKVLVGNESGDLMLDEYLTREQALVILARLMGVEEEAKNTMLQSSFTDVDHPYYEPFIAYAELKGWTNGIGNGLFGYGQKLTVQQCAAYMLRALGYDTPYEGVVETAQNLGLLEGVAASDATAMILRGQTAVMMYNTLMTKPNNSDMTLMQQLGLEMPSTGVAAIQKVEASNLKQLKVYFTSPIEEAGDEDNWSVDKKASFEITEDANFELSEDKMMVTITLSDDEVAEQQEVVTLTCKDLLDEEVVVEDIQFLDVTIPEVVEAEVIGINTLKVTFSEPMAYDQKGDSTADGSVTKRDNYKVKKADGTKLYVNNVKRTDHGMAVLVELYSDLSDGEITLEVKNAEDYEGFSVKVPAIFNLTVVKDTEKPYIVGFKEASPYEITLIWNEDIKFVDTTKLETTDTDILEDFYHTNTEDTPKKATIDGKELKLEFAYDKDAEIDKLLPQGTAYIYAKSKVVQDYWENKNDKLMFTAEVKLDKEPPTIVSHKQKDQDTLEVKFSEDIYNKDDYEIKLLKDGKKAKTGFSYAYKPDKEGQPEPDFGKVLVFTFNKDMSGDYTLVFEDVEDRAGNEMPKTNYDVTFEDKSRPNAGDFKVTAYDVNEKDQKLVINFKEEMDTASITDPDNYYLAEVANNGSEHIIKDNLDDDDIDFEVLEDGEKLLITIPEDVYDITLIGNAIKESLRVGQLKDAAGNKMNTFTALLEIKNGDADLIESSAKLKGQKEIEITIEDDVRSKLDLKKITVGTTSGTAIGTKFEIASSNVKLDDGETVITLKLKDDQGTISTNMAYAIEAGIKNKYGAEVKPYAANTITDKAAPEVEEVYVHEVNATKSVIIVEFTEVIDEDSLAVVGNNGFTDSEDLIKKKGSGVVEWHGKYLVITEEDADENFDKYTDLSYDGKNNLQDAAGNRVDEFDRTKKLKDPSAQVLSDVGL